MLKLIAGAIAAWAIVPLAQFLILRARSMSLPGPPRKNWFWGISREVDRLSDPGTVHERWAEQYGAVYRLPTVLGSRRVVLCDPKAIAHFYNHESSTYMRRALSKATLGMTVGKGVLWAEGDDHRRQRKALAPAFSVTALKNALPVFYDSAYKVKSVWDGMIDVTSKGHAVIDVQDWMNHISLDSIGLAGFSHNFGTLEGKHSDVAAGFEALGDTQPTAFNRAMFLLAGVFPILINLPSQRHAAMKRLTANINVIAAQMLDSAQREAVDGEDTEDKSIIGTLIRAEKSQSGLHLSQVEVIDQMKLLLFAGYETTSISLTWALVELSRNPDVQRKLREELENYGGDPHWDDLMHNLPYLDALLHETLRVHPPVLETIRDAQEDDVLPLSEPLRLPSGQVVDRVSLCAGETISVSIACINRSEAIWGPDAKVFRPERWIDENGLPSKAQEVQGYRHLLTFGDGPRLCIGKTFAQAEFKAVLSVLVRNYSFELRDGPKTEIGTKRGVLPRPTMKGEEGVHLPLVVRRID